ncbi:MAG TPA: ABC transporter permease subunit [Anaerohalosphaeraceae bacterium]|nr:ABC transporter permease subunit [Anaerohalosphaeraceae bacterium]
MMKDLFKLRSTLPRWLILPLGLIPMILLLVIWWIMTAGPVEQRMISPTLLPSPVEVADSTAELFRRDLPTHTLASLKRIGLGYLLALAIAVPLGITMGALSFMRALFTPLTTASGYIPIATLVPLTLSWFGTGELQKVIFLAMAFGIYLLPLIVSAIDNVADVYIKTAYTLGASTPQIVFHVMIPIAMPDIWNAMRLAFGVGWTYLVLTEVVVMESGLGYLVQISFRRGPREHIYLVIVLITLIAWAADLLWDRLGRMMFRYRGTA